MIIDGDVKRLPTGMLGTTATPSIATNGNPQITGHTLDIEMQQISWEWMFVTHHRGSEMQIAPAIEMSPFQNPADGGWTQSGV